MATVDLLVGFLTRPIEGEGPYLWIDATYLNVRESGWIISTAAIIAFCVNTDGRREVLGVATGPSEAEPFWKAFLHSLADRGLRAVAGKVFAAGKQRCRVHWIRNALAHAARKQRPAVIAMIKTIFAQETAEAAHQQWEQVADALRDKFLKLADMMDASCEDVLAYMAFPKDHWAQIASTNPLERVNREIKRRADIISFRMTPPSYASSAR